MPEQPKKTVMQRERYAAFDFRARTPEALKLVERLHSEVLSTESRDRKRRETDAVRFLETVERFLGELLRAKGQKNGTGRFRRSMKTAAFSGGAVSHTNVTTVRDALCALGYLNHEKGSPIFGPGFDGGTGQWTGFAASFEATPALVELAETFSVKLDDIETHFRLIRQPIEARTSSKGDWWSKDRGLKVSFDHTTHTRKLADQVAAINDFLRGTSIEGGAHDTFYRLFNQCDDISSYGWDKGGRLYSDSGSNADSYQSQDNSEDDSGQRKRTRITIGGERTVEIDISASYLTIFHALVGEPLVLNHGDDPYARIDADRDLVKGWITASFGNSKPCEKWPPKFSARYAEQHGGTKPSEVCKASQVKDLVFEAYPLMWRLGQHGLTWADLMFVESEVILKTMIVLMHKGIPSMPVHDSLIVPVSDVAEAARTLYLSFHSLVGCLPALKTDSALPGVRDMLEDVRREMDGLATKSPSFIT